jgi:hypothetical protein
MQELLIQRARITAWKRELVDIKVELKFLRFVRAAIKAGFDPDQPRDDRGMWTDSGSDGGAVGQDGSVMLAGRISPAREAECEELRIRDEFHCRMVGLRACWGQAMLRYGNCLAGLPIPRLNY